MNWRWVGTTALLTAGVLSYGIFVHRDGADQNAVEPPPRLGYYFKDAIITDTTVTGMPRIRLAARSIEQNPTDQSVSLQEVNVDYLAIPDRPWHLQAESGHLPAESSALTFSGNVALRATGAANGAVLHTESLTIDTQKNVALTDSPVAIDIAAGGKGGNRILARGLYADLNSAKLKLNSAVHGRFSPHE